MKLTDQPVPVLARSGRVESEGEVLAPSDEAERTGDGQRGQVRLKGPVTHYLDSRQLFLDHVGHKTPGQTSSSEPGVDDHAYVGRSAPVVGHVASRHHQASLAEPVCESLRMPKAGLRP